MEFSDVAREGADGNPHGRPPDVLTVFILRCQHQTPPTSSNYATDGDIFTNLYFKQGGEVESRGGAGLEVSPQGSPPATATYWRASGPESPTRLHSHRYRTVTALVTRSITALDPH
ncbi:hypothetical protein EVAR_58037_1 [Eumeta japonica]|uniref:Uncharacterized protein n=1 Tax=Eumeta variegata TaxID=151549 RepID=A0A4C1ZJR6_EUMVA|nr:hypothetical protein EVAR_58037_1 [Eumeta japonica]